MQNLYMSLPFLEAVRAFMNLVAARREQLSESKWRDVKTLRYLLGNGFKAERPKQVISRHMLMSIAASAQYDEKRGEGGPGIRSYTRAGLRYEHVVPISTLHELLFDARLSLTATDDVLRNFYHVAWITLDEDARLNKSGMRTKMPIGWNGSNPFARYDAVGVQLEPLRE